MTECAKFASQVVLRMSITFGECPAYAHICMVVPPCLLGRYSGQCFEHRQSDLPKALKLPRSRVGVTLFTMKPPALRHNDCDVDCMSGGACVSVV